MFKSSSFLIAGSLATHISVFNGAISLVGRGQMRCQFLMQAMQNNKYDSLEGFVKVFWWVFWGGFFFSFWVEMVVRCMDTVPWIVISGGLVEKMSVLYLDI